MTILSQELAADIYNCHAEIDRAKKLLEKVVSFIEEDKKPHGDIVQDISRSNRGNYNNLQLGIPSGNSSHHLLYLSPHLGRHIIEAHLSKMEARLFELSSMAAVSLNNGSKL